MDYKKSPTSIAISILLVVVVLAMLGFIFSERPAVTVLAPTTDGFPNLSMTGNVSDLVDVSIEPGQSLSGVTTITGSLKGAYFFEATATGKVLDENKNTLKTFPLTSTSDWMTTDAVSFTGTVDLTGIRATQGYIRLGNENPSGDPSGDKYVDIPVVFQ